ncbi:hypothetical protein EUA06_02555 [Nocardioides glacieisoli]|uniref:Uncharacterized protein n=1 Tax=Nocardioides glacieisoli TaxID=1168730 RepID=A0A4Q2S3Y9_9ACTN|nr:UPF0158 family protein [Nocardioides glacieisoli]RYB96470.1 hypothetical protein EUA06_02555 [Nocardioides glacieisoli]
MSQRERLREFRAAVFTADGEALVSLLRAGPWPGHALELIGDGLLAALAQNVGGARELAERCVTDLRERDWEGDEDLVAALTARLGAGPAPLLRSLPVDLDELVDVLEGDAVAGGGRIDLHTGEVWPEAVFEYGLESEEEGEGEDLDDGERWLWVVSEGSRAGYRDMELFVGGVAEPDLADRLARTLKGRGSFRRFRDELSRWPGLQDRWYVYSAERRRGRARAWLAAEGFAPAAPAADGAQKAT